MGTLDRSSLQYAQRQAESCMLAAERSYYVWTIGCQMNRADSRRTGAELERLGFRPAARLEDADLVVLNTCVVRQSAEDKAVGRLSSLRHYKEKRPGATLVLMGCLVGDVEALRAQFPHVDLFVRPSDVEGLVAWVRERLPAPASTGVAHPGRQRAVCPSPFSEREGPGAVLSGSEGASHTPVSAEVPAMMGCDRHCTYCIVRLRRGCGPFGAAPDTPPRWGGGRGGPGRSRHPEEVAAEAEALVRAGAREIVLLGQNIDAYGRDLPGTPSLADLLRRVHEIPGLLRLRFLTSHPADLDGEVIDAVAELPKACAHWELPVQAGDDHVLRRMGRGHTAATYLALIEHIRRRLPQAAIATDIIVGFPGETAEQFERTLDLLRTVRFDTVHVAAYSVRPGTPAARLADDVPPEEKARRRRAVEDLQEHIVGEINAGLLGQEVEVLVGGPHKGKWKGRTATNKLVFFEHAEEWRGRLATVRITKTGPWSLQGELR